MRCSGNCFPLDTAKFHASTARKFRRTSTMVAFKRNFHISARSQDNSSEFNRDWLHAAITRAAHEAGYPSWWLTDHVTESIALSASAKRRKRRRIRSALADCALRPESDRLQGDCAAFVHRSRRPFPSRCWTSRATLAQVMNSRF